jgi:PAS domain S-box-containing protein
MSRQKRTLLLVEDSPEDRGTYQAFLRQDRECDYTFLEEEDAERALEVCREREVDCILLDYQLPGMNGLEFLRRLREREGLLPPPVVMLTGRGSEQLAVQALKGGAADYLVKSDVTPPNLFRAVRNTIEREELRRRVTAQDAERQHLMAERAQLAAVVANAASLVVFTTREGHVRYLNEAGRRMVGLEPGQDVSSVRVADLLTEEDLALYQSRVLPVLEQEGRWRGEFRLRHLRSGTLIPAQHDIFILTHEEGTPPVLASISQDISEQKRQEQEVRQRAEFEQYLAGIVGHDLRNPINAIALSAALLLRREDLDARVRETVSRILTSAERTNRMIDTTLDFTQARLGGGLRVERKPLDLHELTRQVVDEVQLNFPERRVEVDTRGPGAGEWDPDRMAQVLTNLVTNALKYSATGSPVTVRTRGEERSFTLEVHNQGDPIPEELLPRLFLPMKRVAHETAQRGRSLGLGLFIVDHLVRAHGGSIEVASDVEHGTTFTVRLPRLPETPG